MNSSATLHRIVSPLIAALLLSAFVGSAVNAATVSEEFATSAAGDAVPAPAPVAVVGDGDAGGDGGEVVGVVVFDDVVPELGFDADTEDSSRRFEPCSLKEPTRNECIRDLFGQIVPLLKDEGLPEYSMNSIDPYSYRRGIFRYTNDGVQGGLLIKDMQINGISGLKVNSIASNFSDDGQFLMKLNIEIPKIIAAGQFKADVKFGGLRLVPKGPFNITIDNIKLTVLTDGIIEEKEKGRRLRLQRLNAIVGVGKAHIIANGIFSDRNLNTMMLNLVNENLPEIVRVGIPATREQWAPILVSHVNDFFADVPIDKFLVE